MRESLGDIKVLPQLGCAALLSRSADYTKRAEMRTASASNLAFAVILTLLGVFFISCGYGPAKSSSGKGHFTEDEKHRLYAAALAASDSPLDSEIFKSVCQRIEIFDATGKPNDKYMQFVSAHVDWAAKPQAAQFRNQIDTPQKARQYIDQHLV